jgi:hypothetical protein
MFDKEVNIPKVFNELHGEKSPLSSIIMVYLAGAVATVLVISQILPERLPVWKIVLVGILYMDIGGGVVANLSSSTNQYYQGKGRLRIGFILLHCLHPTLFILMFPDFWPYFIYIGLFTLISALLVNAFRDAEFQQNLAAFLVMGGTIISFSFDVPLVIFFSFAPLFMVKLILGFSVRRPALT